MKPVSNLHKHDEMVPLYYHLSQNFPNPFIKTSAVKFNLAFSGRVKIKLLYSYKETIRIVLDETKAPGTCQIMFETG